MTGRIELLEMTVRITSSFVANHTISMQDVPHLLERIFQSLSELSAPTGSVPNGQPPAVPIKKSVTDDTIYCLEDGRPFQTLKRHLKSDHSMTPEEYRKKWGLPSDYSMVAANYAKRRSQLAKDIGLGLKKKKTRPARN